MEFQMLSKDAANKIKAQISQISVRVFSLKTCRLKINGTETKVSDKKN